MNYQGQAKKFQNNRLRQGQILSWRWKFLFFFLRLEGFCRNKIFQKWFLETRQVRKSAALFLLRRWKRKRESNFIFLEKNCFLRHGAKNERAGFPSLNPWENLGWLTSEPAIGSPWIESTQNNAVGFVAGKGFFEALMGTALFLNIRQLEFLRRSRQRRRFRFWISPIRIPTYQDDFVFYSCRVGVAAKTAASRDQLKFMMVVVVVWY